MSRQAMERQAEIEKLRKENETLRARVEALERESQSKQPFGIREPKGIDVPYFNDNQATKKESAPTPELTEEAIEVFRKAVKEKEWPQE